MCFIINCFQYIIINIKYIVLKYLYKFCNIYKGHSNINLKRFSTMEIVIEGVYWTQFYTLIIITNVMLKFKKNYLNNF